MIELIGFKFVTTSVLVLKKLQKEDKVWHGTFCLPSKVETIINEKYWGNWK